MQANPLTLRELAIYGLIFLGLIVALVSVSGIALEWWILKHEKERQALENEIRQAIGRGIEKEEP
jgi:hypothetical protein